jgi:hypothetical protein
MSRNAVPGLDSATPVLAGEGGQKDIGCSFRRVLGNRNAHCLDPHNQRQDHPDGDQVPGSLSPGTCAGSGEALAGPYPGRPKRRAPRPAQRGLGQQQSSVYAQRSSPARGEPDRHVQCPRCGVELWATTDACRALGVSRKTWAQWRRRSGFPTAVGELGGRPVWDAASVRAWADAREPSLRRDAGRNPDQS